MHSMYVKKNCISCYSPYHAHPPGEARPQGRTAAGLQEILRKIKLNI